MSTSTISTVHVVGEAEDAPTAVIEAERLQPDVIVLDVLMPGMDGWAVLRSLKADPLTAAIPVVVVSMLEDRDVGFALGAADYLTKPVKMQELRRRVQLHLERRVLSDENRQLRQRLQAVLVLKLVRALTETFGKY